MAKIAMIYWLGLVYLSLLLLKSWLALRYVRRYVKSEPLLSQQDVTVTTPIRSGDPQLTLVLQDNLEALPYASFCLLVDDDDPEAQRVVNELIKRYPAHAIEVVVYPPAPAGINPKLFKLEGAGKRIRTSVLLVLDDDTRLTARSLNALLAALEQAELATGLPYYREGGNWLSNLLGQFVNNNSAQTYLPLLHVAGPVSINGMCYALRTETLEKIGGFAPVLSHLTDDLAVADLVRKQGGRIHQTPLPQEVATTITSPVEYLLQMHRWFLFATLLIRRQTPAMNALITLLHGLPPLLLLSTLILVAATPTLFSCLFVSGLLALRAITLVTVQSAVFGKLPQHPLLSLLSELLQPLHLLHAVCWRRIRWRTRRYQVFDNDRFVSR